MYVNFVKSLNSNGLLNMMMLGYPNCTEKPIVVNGLGYRLLLYCR